MKNAKVYHGGASPQGKFSSGAGGDGEASDWITLELINDENLNIGDEIVCPTLSGFQWQATYQGWYFPLQYTLK